jgi:glycosyl hydrolase family 1
MRRGVGAAFLAALALLAAVPAHASSSARFGIQDDAWLEFGPGTLAERVATLDGLGVRVVRFTLRWDAVAPRRPARATNQADPAYRWGVYGDVVDELHAQGISVLLTLWGSPRWANGGGAPNRLPTSGLAAFATAAAARFPFVHLWTVWNEPNSRTFSVPVSPKLYVTRALNPVYAALHRASPVNQVAGGVTSPRKTPSGLAPLEFMEGMRAAHARLDAYAQNPYPVGRGETPSRGSCGTCFTMASLAEIRGDVTRSFGPKPLWLTEYGYQTNPPDRLLGVSYAKQATYLGEAALRVWQQPGVTVLIQFLLRDEPSIGGWQSGLVSARGAPKPSYHAFALPLAQVSRRGRLAVLWGQVRPGSGARTYVLQRAVDGRWQALGRADRTGVGGTFVRTVALPAGTRVRLFAEAVGYASPALTLS